MSEPVLSDPDFIDLHAAGKIVGVTHYAVRRWIAAGRLPAFRFGPRILRVRRSDVVALGRPVPTAGTR